MTAVTITRVSRANLIEERDEALSYVDVQPEELERREAEGTITFNESDALDTVRRIDALLSSIE